MWSYECRCLWVFFFRRDNLNGHVAPAPGNMGLVGKQPGGS